MAISRSRVLAASPLAYRSLDLDDQSADDVSHAVQSQCNVFDTTFSLYRVSPLFVGADALSPKRLAGLSQRLRDLLVGDVVRGVQVGLDGSGNETMSGAGSLEDVLIEWVDANAVLGIPAQALELSLQYENAVCSALLLPAGDAPDGPFLRLPLLLLRMPTPLKSVIVSFLSSTFDCRIGPLRLNSDDIVLRWEAWVRSAPLTKDVLVTLGLRLPGQPRESVPDRDEGEIPDAAVSGTTLGLRSIDIIIPSQDLPHFREAGKTLDLAGRGADRPFMEALSHYVNGHLALDLSNPAVSVVRIACGGFVLAETRVKIFRLPAAGRPSAVQQFVFELAKRAARSL